MAIFVKPMDTREFEPRFGRAQLLGWKIIVPGNPADIIGDYILEIIVDNLINDLDRQTECDLMILR